MVKYEVEGFPEHVKFTLTSQRVVGILRKVEQDIRERMLHAWHELRAFIEAILS